MSETAKERIAPFAFVADSEREIADALATALNENGYEAVALSSGEQLVEAATVIKPNIVICELIMGGMTGTEAAIRICQNIPQCRVILCVAPEFADELLCRVSEAYGFVIFPKPVDPGALLRYLDRITNKTAA